ncbi:MAG: type II toxin-antitoxin system RelE/ParE family toxin [Acidobacteriota bacterium]
MTAVRWTEQAVGDLQSIRQYIERDSPRYGRLVAERLFEATSRLEAFPHSGRSCRS